MNVLLYADATLDIRLSPIVENLNRICSGISFARGNEVFLVPGSVVSVDNTYRELSPSLLQEAKTADQAILFTKKPYDNNFFWESKSNLCIISFFAWEDLTTLPVNNGAVYFIAALLCREIDLGIPHDDNIGCINDFWWDKRGVDVGMRAAFICPQCQQAFKRRKNPKKKLSLYNCVTAILNDISHSSRANSDIVDFWRLSPTHTDFDVFLCHNSEDKPEIRTISEQLKLHGIRPWLDEDELRPGLAWQDTLEQQIPVIKTAAVFVGPNGTGPWQDVEIRAFLREFVRRRCIVIPVILSNATTATTVPELPVFLRQMTWIDMRKDKPDPMKLLLWGITGIRQS